MSREPTSGLSSGVPSRRSMDDLSDEEAEWTPRRSRSRPCVSENGDDSGDFEEEEADDEDENGNLRGFLASDDDTEVADDSSESGDENDGNNAPSEAEEDIDFDGPLNRPKRNSAPLSTTKSTDASKKKRKRQSMVELSPRGARKEQRNRTRRRELAEIRDDNDLEDRTQRARDAEKARASHMLFQTDDNDIDIELDPLPDDLLEEEEKKAPVVCLNLRVEDGKVPTGEVGTLTQPVFVHPAISPKLKKHQVKGAQFLWSHVGVEPTGFGCILADFMGLGKTLQVITAVQAFLALKTRRASDGALVNRHKHVLILAPTICVRNWEAEVVKWLGKKDARRLGVHTLESSREKKMSDRVYKIKEWHRRGGLLIMGYELYRILVLQSSGDEKIAAGNAKHSHLIKEAYKYLSDPGPDLIVLDEGHRVRDHKSKLVKALSHVKTSRRIILTGYPLQNHLEEYWTMVNFARPDYLGSLEDFKNRFVHPIENGQCVDSTEEDRRLARQRAYVLTNELKTLVLRRDQEFLFRQLPPKKEWVFLCKLTDPQATLYRRFLQSGVPKRGELMPGVGGKIDVLGGYHISLAIANHPDVLQDTYRALEDAIRTGKFQAGGRKSKARNTNHDDDGEDEDLLQYLAVDIGNGRAKGPATATAAAARNASTLALYDDDDDDEDSLLEALDAPSAARSPFAAASTGGGGGGGPEHRLSFARDFMRDYTSGMLESSGKMLLLMELLHECKAIDDRVILFSQSIPTLNTVEAMIAQANRNHKRHTKRISYLRIDGSTPQQERFRMISQFNDLEEDVDLIMISTKAGGEGVNLCAGNRIVIFDVCWNPCNDSQSMCRSYRFGQVKPVFVYRFVSAGTMEKKVYDLQIRKEGVAKRIVDEKALERKFKTADLQNYFNLDEFEAAMQQQSTVLARGGVPLTLKPATENAHADETGMDGDDADGVDGIHALPAAIDGEQAPGNDHVLRKVLNKLHDERKDWVLDWFEQETMFEETIDDSCTIDEQEEITSSYKYIKALRRLKLDNPYGVAATSRAESVLLVMCMICRMSNDVYPEETTHVPVPKYIECRYCKRQTLTTGALTHAQALAAVQAGGATTAAGGVPRGYMPYNTGSSAQLDTGGVVPPMPGGAVVAGRVLPPHLQMIRLQQAQQQALLAQQQQQQRQQQQIAAAAARAAAATGNVVHASELLRRQMEQQQRDMEKRKKERETWMLSDRNLLVLRRGITKVQDLKRAAQECGAAMAIEVSPQLTDIVSSMSLEETLQWLKLTKLPRDVELHGEAWLRNEITREKGLVPASKASPAGNDAVKLSDSPSSATGVAFMTTSPSGGSADGATSRATIAIDLSDSDNDDNMDGSGSGSGGNPTPIKKTGSGVVGGDQVPTGSGQAAAAAAADDDFIEIL